MAFDGNELLFGTGAKSMGFEPESVIAEMAAEGEDVKLKTHIVRGRVTDFSKNHRRKFQPDGKGALLYWSSDGKPTEEKTDRPVKDPVMTLQTAYRAFEGSTPKDDNDEDYGLRRIFLQGRKAPKSLLEALQNAMGKAGVRRVREGDYVEYVCTGLGRRVGQGGKPAPRSIAQPKEFAATYWTAANPPDWADALDEGLDLDVIDDEGDDNPFDE